MAVAADETRTDELLYDVADHVATITLNRPEVQNTISGPMLAALSARLIEADNDTEVRAIVITGSGRFFCAGLDLRGGGIAAGLSNERAAPANLDLRTAPPTVLHSLDTPTICALNGSAAGYGMDLALGCDIRLMADTAKLAAAFTARGVVPESGGTWLLPRLIGWSKAAEIIFTGRTLLADECERLGLVSRVVPAAELPDAASSSRPGCPERLSQNRTCGSHIRLLGTAGYDPGGRPVHDLAVSQLRVN